MSQLECTVAHFSKHASLIRRKYPSIVIVNESTEPDTGRAAKIDVPDWLICKDTFQKQQCVEFKELVALPVQIKNVSEPASIECQPFHGVVLLKLLCFDGKAVGGQ